MVKEMEIRNIEESVNSSIVFDLEHEVKGSKISEEQLYYLMSHSLNEEIAREMIFIGFVDSFTKELPVEYAVEFKLGCMGWINHKRSQKHFQVYSRLLI